MILKNTNGSFEIKEEATTFDRKYDRESRRSETTRSLYTVIIASSEEKLCLNKALHYLECNFSLKCTAEIEDRNYEVFERQLLLYTLLHGSSKIVV